MTEKRQHETARVWWCCSEQALRNVTGGKGKMPLFVARVVFSFVVLCFKFDRNQNQFPATVGKNKTNSGSEMQKEETASIEEERRNTSFSIRELTYFLFGGQHATESYVSVVRWSSTSVTCHKRNEHYVL